MEYTKEANVKYSYSRPKKDITGMKFNQLEVIEWVGFKKVGSEGRVKRRSVYKCKCSCGNECHVTQTDLKSGNVKSCGCRIKENKGSYKGENYSTISTILNNYRQSAKKHGRKFDLTRDQLVELISSNCYYCGNSPSLEKNAKNRWDKPLAYNGIDRVDNTKGYTLENVVCCCKTCNFLKKDIPQDEFLSIIKKIYLCRIQ